MKKLRMMLSMLLAAVALMMVGCSKSEDTTNSTSGDNTTNANPAGNSTGGPPGSAPAGGAPAGGAKPQATPMGVDK